MQQPKTCPVLVPPPPVPPVPRAPAAAADGAPDPPRVGTCTATSSHLNYRASFFGDVLLDLRRMVWPTRHELCAGTLATIGLLSFFGGYLAALHYVMQALLHGLGVY